MAGFAAPIALLIVIDWCRANSLEFVLGYVPSAPLRGRAEAPPRSRPVSCVHNTAPPDPGED